MTREIILDTETTGLDPFAGHRIVEIGCVELINLMPTGNVFHCYINPQRDMPTEAFQVHGLSAEFLSQHPTFSEVALGFLEFIGTDSKIVIHNASFDMKFLDWEIGQVGHPKIDRTRVVDTLEIARKLNPGGRNSLDALCKRYGINNAHRTYHGALLDSELLAEVYLYLRGGRQPTFLLDTPTAQESITASSYEHTSIDFPYRKFSVNEAELTEHTNFIHTIKNAKWHTYS